MEFSIEIFTAICMTLTAVVAGLRKAGFIELPYRKKWTDNERSENIMPDHNQRPECTAMFKNHARKIDVLEEGKTRNETNLANQKEQLKKGEEHFIKLEETMTDFGNVMTKFGVHLEYLVKSEKKRNGDI